MTPAILENFETNAGHTKQKRDMGTKFNFNLILLQRTLTLIKMKVKNGAGKCCLLGKKCRPISCCNKYANQHYMRHNMLFENIIWLEI